jgi:hypothetical protein
LEARFALHRERNAGNDRGERSSMAAIPAAWRPAPLL